MSKTTKGANMAYDPNLYRTFSYSDATVKAIVTSLDQYYALAKKAEAELAKERELVKQLIEAGLGMMHMESIRRDDYDESNLFGRLAKERLGIDVPV